jgi:glutathione S-transferase
MTPRLVGTPLSHFTRKIRILLTELGVVYEFDRSRSVLAPEAAAFGDNPLRRVPTLVVGDEYLVHSDHIARWVVSTYDPGDRFGVRSERPADLNRLAVINGIMDNEVVIILAKRAGGAAFDGGPYFAKLAAAIEESLAWLERATPEHDAFDYRDVALVCMWQHVVHYASAPALDRFPRTAARVDRFAARPSVASTAPEAALAEARAAGWTPL